MLTYDERRNERLKLMANLTNTVATAVFTVGSFLPIANYAYGILPANVEGVWVYYWGGVCIGIGAVIHLIGQWILGGLR